jgi:hypothetical protein
MGLVRYLQHWLSGTGTPLQVTNFVPQSEAPPVVASVFAGRY